jgi:hypothetical protein
MEIMLLSEYFNLFDGVEFKINEFDKYLLKEHINQQKKLIGTNVDLGLHVVE